MTAYQTIIPLVLKHEGGYVNHPSDPGGATNKGITIATFRKFIKPGGSIADLKAMTTAQAVVVYKRQYWDAVMADSLPAGVNYTVFDYAVNSGPGRATRELQDAVGVEADGRIGPLTLAAVKAANPDDIINDICDNRLAFMKRIRGGSLWTKFGRGWAARVDRVRSGSLSMADTPPTATPEAYPLETPVEAPKPASGMSTPAKGLVALVAAGGGALALYWDKLFGG